MHKFLIGFCICVISLVLTACQFAPNSSYEPCTVSESDVKEQGGRECGSDNNNDTGHSAGFQWLEREVPEPTIEEIQAKYVVHNGAKAGLLLSPWQSTEFDLNETMTSLKNVPFLNGWTLGSQTTEIGYATADDTGQTNQYQRVYTILGSASEANVINGNSELCVEYQENTEAAIGYTDISLRYNIPEEEVTSETQTQMHVLLQNIFSEEYADFLCYAQQDEGSLLLEIKQDNAKIYFRRNLTPTSLIFSVKIVSLLNENGVAAFPGQREWTPLIDTSKHIHEFVNPKFGDMKLQHYSNIGAKTFQEYFNQYNGTISGYPSSYTMQVLRLNSQRIEKFYLNAMLAQTDVYPLLSPDFIVDYTVIYHNDVVTDVICQLKCSAGQTDATVDIKHARAKFENAASQMIRALLKDSVDVHFTPKQDGNYEPYQYQAKICGLDKTVTLRFEMGNTMADKLVSYFYVSIT